MKTKCTNQNLQILSLQHWRYLMKSFFASQFAYCPLEWMCYDKTFDNRKITYANLHLGRFTVTNF